MKTNAQYWDDFLKDGVPDSYNEWFKREASIIKKFVKCGDVVLDIGCGSGRALGYLNISNLKYIGVDKSEEVISNANNQFSDNKNVHFFVSDAKKINYPDEEFDVVLCLGNTFGNLFQDREVVINEVWRVLKHGGLFIGDVFSENSIAERMKVYKKYKADVSIASEGSVRFSDGESKGVSEHFTKQELLSYLSDVNMVVSEVEDCGIAYIFVAYKE